MVDQFWASVQIVAAMISLKLGFSQEILVLQMKVALLKPCRKSTMTYDGLLNQAQIKIIKKLSAW